MISKQRPATAAATTRSPPRKSMIDDAFPSHGDNDAPYFFAEMSRVKILNASKYFYKFSPGPSPTNSSANINSNSSLATGITSNRLVGVTPAPPPPRSQFFGSGRRKESAVVSASEDSQNSKCLVVVNSSKERYNGGSSDDDDFDEEDDEVSNDIGENVYSKSVPQSAVSLPPQTSSKMATATNHSSIPKNGWLRSEEIRGVIFGVPKDYLTKDLSLGELLLRKPGAMRAKPREGRGISTSRDTSTSNVNMLLRSSSGRFNTKSGTRDSPRGKLRPGMNIPALSQAMRSRSSNSLCTRVLPFVKNLQGPVLFTAPHGIKLYRGQSHPGEPVRVHKVERWSTEIALRLAESMSNYLSFEGSSMVWDPVLIGEPPDAANYDPNYLSRSDFELSPWNQMLREWSSMHSGAPRLHVDVHGKRDRKTNWDLDVGFASMMQGWPDIFLPQALCTCLCDQLEAALTGTKYTVNRNPVLDGLWPSKDCHTMSHQSVLLRTPAVQLEIPRSLRADLTSDDVLFARFARAIATTYQMVFYNNAYPSSPSSSSSLSSSSKRVTEQYTVSYYSRNNKGF